MAEFCKNGLVSSKSIFRERLGVHCWFIPHFNRDIHFSISDSYISYP